MNVLRLLLLLIFFFWGSTGWTQPALNEWLNTSGSSPKAKEVADQRVLTLVTSLRNDQASDHKVLQRLFHKVHATFLKRYEAYADFQSLFTNGTYDCLTATALFSHLLTELNFDFAVMETNYHIFILVQTSRGQVMLETTDRLGGFVTDEEIIARRTADYRENVFSTENGGVAYQYSFHLYQQVPPEKITGLLLYNQAVKAYNQRDWMSCASLLERAHAVYATPRCEELGDILVRTVFETKASGTIQRECLSRLKSVLMASATTVSLN